MTKVCILLLFLSFVGLTAVAIADGSVSDSLAKLPELSDDLAAPAKGDWLVTPVQRHAGVYRAADDARADGTRSVPATFGPQEIVMTNGLLRRTWRIAPNAACVSMKNLVTGEELLRSVRPEAIVDLDGVKYPVGGLAGQPIHNYLDPKWLEKMTAPPGAFELESIETGTTKERFPWKKRLEWMPQDMPWPPTGASLTLHFRPPQGKLSGRVTVDVHYEMYDGIPLLSKWITVAESRHGAAAVEHFRERNPGGGRT